MTSSFTTLDEKDMVTVIKEGLNLMNSLEDFFQEKLDILNLVVSLNSELNK